MAGNRDCVTKAMPRRFEISKLGSGFLPVLTFGVCISACHVPGEEPLLKPVLREGKWTHQGMKTILGVGTDTTILIKRANDRWTIEYEMTHFPSVNEKGAGPKTERKGPYGVTVQDQFLVITKE